MTITVMCPNRACGRSLDAPMRLAGLRVRCPSCHRTLLLPDERELPTEELPPQLPAPRRPRRRRRRRLPAVAIWLPLAAAGIALAALWFFDVDLATRPPTMAAVTDSLEDAGWTLQAEEFQRLAGRLRLFVMDWRSTRLACTVEAAGRGDGSPVRRVEFHYYVPMGVGFTPLVRERLKLIMARCVAGFDRHVPGMLDGIIAAIGEMAKGDPRISDGRIRLAAASELDDGWRLAISLDADEATARRDVARCTMTFTRRD